MAEFQAWVKTLEVVVMIAAAVGGMVMGMVLAGRLITAHVLALPAPGSHTAIDPELIGQLVSSIKETMDSIVDEKIENIEQRLVDFQGSVHRELDDMKDDIQRLQHRSR